MECHMACGPAVGYQELSSFKSEAICCNGYLFTGQLKKKLSIDLVIADSNGFAYFKVFSMIPLGDK